MQNWEISHSYDHRGRRVCYGRLGEGPPMVLVHGTPWSSFNLRHLIRKLSENYTVYFFDLLGYGQSCTTEGDVSLGVQNDVLDGLLAHWGLDDPIIVGHDFGGATVLRTHLLNKRSFKKIILIDPVAVSPWGSPFFRHVNQHEAAFTGLPDYIHEAPLYPTITTPTLILWGREDSWIPLERGEELHGLIPGSVLHVIDDAGHLVIEEKPDELVREILDFVEA